MSLLNQITPTLFTSYFRALSYEKLHQRFERPNDALGYRHRNPLTRIYYKFSELCQVIVGPLLRIEITIRLKPQ